MENNNENIERENEKLPVQTRVDSEVFNVISNLAAKEERSISKMVERLLKTNPQVQHALELEAAVAGVA